LIQINLLSRNSSSLSPVVHDTHALLKVRSFSNFVNITFWRQDSAKKTELVVGASASQPVELGTIPSSR